MISRKFLNITPNRDIKKLLSLSLTKNRRRSLQALCQKVLKLYLAIKAYAAKVWDYALWRVTEEGYLEIGSLPVEDLPV